MSVTYMGGDGKQHDISRGNTSRCKVGIRVAPGTRSCCLDGGGSGIFERFLVS